MNYDWVLFDGNTAELKCLRCGTAYKPNLPCPVDMFVAVSNTFLDSHRTCSKPKPLTNQSNAQATEKAANA